jgi:hypothetical protein
MQSYAVCHFDVALIELRKCIVIARARDAFDQRSVFSVVHQQSRCGWHKFVPRHSKTSPWRCPQRIRRDPNYFLRFAKTRSVQRKTML